MGAIAKNLHGFVVFLAGRDGVMIMPGFHIQRTDMERFAAGAIIIPATHIEGAVSSTRRAKGGVAFP